MKAPSTSTGRKSDRGHRERVKRRRDGAASVTTSEASLLDLQRTAGNRAVTGLLTAQREPPTAPPRAGSVSTGAVAPVGVPVDKLGIVAHDPAEGGQEPGVNLRTVPTESGNTPTGRLPHNQRLFVKSRFPGNWLYVVATDGRSGYVSGIYVKTEDEMPDPGSRLHRIKPNETAFDIVGRYYGASAYKAGQDARFYSNVLVYANEKHRRFGIREPTDEETLSLIKQMGFGKYLDAWTVAGAEIWIPSKEFADTLKGEVSAGSSLRDAWEKVKDLGGQALELVVRIPAFIGGLLVGVGESLVDAVQGVVDLVKSIVTGEIVDTVSALIDLFKDPEKLKAILAELGDDLEKKLTHPNPVKAWYWRGWLIGYVVGEVLGAIVTAGAGAALKASKFGMKLTQLVKGLGPVKKAMRVARKVAKPVRFTKGLLKRGLRGLLQAGRGIGAMLFGKLGALFGLAKRRAGWLTRKFGSIRARLTERLFYRRVKKLKAAATKFAAAYGFPSHRLMRFYRVATKRKLRIWLRQGNPASLRHLREGAIPKPELIKAKTIKHEDLHLNPDLTPDDIGLVGYFEPKWPGATPPAGVSEAEWRKVLLRWKQREVEFYDNREIMETLQIEIGDKRRLDAEKPLGDLQIRIERGVVRSMDAETAEMRGIAGDIDVLQITKADGTPLGRSDYDEVMDELVESDVAEHGAHLWWDPKTEAELEADRDILVSHQQGELLEVGPKGYRDAKGADVPGFAERLRLAKERAPN